MNRWMVAAIWALVVLDCALIGYRSAMGRRLRLNKRRAHRRASIVAGAMGLVPLSIVTAAAAWMSRPGGALATTDLNAAMGRFLLVGGTYAAVIVSASALCAIPSVTVRAAASVVVFGPLTLLRPLVVIATVGAALGSSPPAPLLALGVLVAVPGVTIEFVMDRRIAAELISPAATWNH